MNRHKLLVLCFDPITESMAGPAIRAWHLAEVLAGEHEVILGSTVRGDLQHPAMDVRSLDAAGLAEAAAWADAIFAPTGVVRRHPALAAGGKPLAIDLYIPTHLENLERGERTGGDHERDMTHQVSVVNEDLGHGDFFLCASERQRDFWLGALASAGRVNPATYAADPALRRLVDVVPFGLPPAPPVSAGHVLRRRFEAIGDADPLIVWGGGVYDWLDPFSLVRAVASLRRDHPAVRLVFLGMRNPHPDIPEMSAARRLRALSDELALTDRHVFFGEEWIPYKEWGATLLDADVAVSTHPDHLETRFSFRTRLLDYLWAGRPMVVTGGDELSETIASHGLGIAVAAGDVPGIAQALDTLIREGVPHADYAAVRARFQWANVARPLVAWCAQPAPAPDRPATAPAPVGQPSAVVPAPVQGASIEQVTIHVLVGELLRRIRRRSLRLVRRARLLR